MGKKTTTGKPAGKPYLQGDRELSKRMADALALKDRAERWTHGFHTYPAGLHPDTAQRLLNMFDGERVLDPFCGGGTVLVEARAAGRAAVGRDLSAVAINVSRVRTATPSDEDLTTFRSAARKMVAEARTAQDYPEERRLKALQDWYAPAALREIESLRSAIQVVKDPWLKGQLTTVLSSILIKVSWRRSDTSTKRVKHRRPPGTTAILFHKKARELARMQVSLREAVPDGTPDAKVEMGDARALKQVEPVDLVLTSPPYPGTYDYLPMQHLRMIWLAQASKHAVEKEIGSRRLWRKGNKDARRQWALDSRAWTVAAASRLQPGGRLVIVIGDGLTPAGPVDCAGVTVDAALDAGLKLEARASVERPDYARDTSRWEHAFAMYRPS